MQQLVILLLINCSSTCFGRLYAHRQEVRLRFHCVWLSVMLWCWRVGVKAVCTAWSRLLATYSTQCTQLASRLSKITTVTTGQKTIGSVNAVWPPEDGRRDSRNMLRKNLLTIKSLIVASSLFHIYLLNFKLLHKAAFNVFGSKEQLISIQPLKCRAFYAILWNMLCWQTWRRANRRHLLQSNQRRSVCVPSAWPGRVWKRDEIIQHLTLCVILSFLVDST